MRTHGNTRLRNKSIKTRWRSKLNVQLFSNFISLQFRSELILYNPSFLRYKVTVVAKEYASPVSSGKRITSEIAGALWEWPPAVCGRHTDEKSLERSKVWCMDSYGKFMELAMNPKETGAYLRQSVFYFKDKVTLFSFQLSLIISHFVGYYSERCLQTCFYNCSCIMFLSQAKQLNIYHITTLSFRSMIFPHSWIR